MVYKDTGDQRGNRCFLWEAILQTISFTHEETYIVLEAYLYQLIEFVNSGFLEVFDPDIDGVVCTY